MESRTLRRALAAVAASWACAAGAQVLPDGTLLLGEISHILTPADVAADQLGPGTSVEKLARRLHNWGFSDEDIAAGRIAVVREGIYWNNVASGIKRDMLNAVRVPEGVKVDAGNIIEGRETPAAQGGYRIERIRAASREAGRCRFVELPTGALKGVLGLLSRVGPSGAATLYCEGIEAEGWQRPRTYWHKLPGTAPQATEPPAADASAAPAAPLPPGTPASASSAPAPAR